MKRSVTFLIAILAVIIISVPAFAATKSASLAVSATVSRVCNITTTPVAFGAYDPIIVNNTTPATATGTVTVTCTKGTSAPPALWVGLDTGLNGPSAVGTTRAMNAGATYLNYELYQDAAHTTVWGNTAATGVAVTFSSGAGLTNPASYNVYGQVPAGQNVAAATYNDTVQATINY